MSKQGVLAVAFGLLEVLAVFGCTSTSTVDGNLTTCKNPSAALEACNACEQTKCTSQAAAVQNECSGVASCESSCDCSDMDCLTACQNGAPSGCAGPALDLISCGFSTCSAQCGNATTDAGTD